MEVNVTRENLKDILIEIKNQYINIAIQDEAGEWSDEYYIVEGIKVVEGINIVERLTLLKD